MTMASIGAVLVATSKAALLLRGRSETEIDTMITVEVEDSSVLAALRLLQRGH